MCVCVGVVLPGDGRRPKCFKPMHCFIVTHAGNENSDRGPGSRSAPTRQATPTRLIEYSRATAAAGRLAGLHPQ